MGILFTIIMMTFALRVTGFILRIVGKMFGSIFGFIVFLMIASFAVKVIGYALIAVPIIMVIGIIGIITHSVAITV